MNDSDSKTLHEALAGDEEAIESLVVGIHAPVFDMAVHWAGPERATDHCLASLTALVLELREGKRPDGGVLPRALSLLFQETTEPRFAPKTFAALSAADRFLWLARLGADLEPEELCAIDGRSAADLQALINAGPSAEEEARLREALDEAAMAVRLPIDLIDRALGYEDEDEDFEDEDAEEEEA